MSEDKKEDGSEHGTEPKITSKVESVDVQARDVKWREQFRVTEAQLAELKSKSASEMEEAKKQIENAAQVKTTLESKLILSELKAKAIYEGIKDVDFLKMIDTSSLSLDETGQVKGIDDILGSFKAAKPDLFGSDKKSSSSSNEKLPAGREETTADAFKMTEEEFKKEKMKYTGSYY